MGKLFLILLKDLALAYVPLLWIFTGILGNKGDTPNIAEPCYVMFIICGY